tara:strand:+ start:3598 stop:8802 length:5205 start_codon:yes stop_codon:yes gene_type:complete
MSGFTEGNYIDVKRINLDTNSVIANTTIDPKKDDFEMFLLDFFPHDKNRVRSLYVDNNQDADDEDDDEHVGFWNEETQRYEKPPKPKRPKNNFVVRVFGLARKCIKDTDDTDTKKKTEYFSISLDLEGFEPFFFIKIPDNWNKSNLSELIERLKTEAASDPNSNYPYGHKLKSWEIVKAKPFYGYTADDKFQYAKLIFENSSGFGQFRRLIEYLRDKSPDYWRQFEMYESNIEPMLRMAHIQEIIPSGWIRVPHNKASLNDKYKSSDCQFHFEMSYRDIVPMPECSDIPPLQVASYDIEADSSHGDFPIAAKNYQKIAQDIITEFLKLPKDCHKNPHYLRALLHSWINLAFHPLFDNNNINRIVTIDDIQPEQDTLSICAEKVLELAEPFHQSIMDLRYQGFEANQIQGYQEYYISKLVIELESLLPEIDYEKSKVGNYQLLAEQLLKENHRMIIAHNAKYLNDPLEMNKFWVWLAFHPYYDNHNINHVYTHKHELPESSDIENIVPQVTQICLECFDHLNKPKEKKKSVPKIGPKKFMKEPPQEGQTKLGKFIKKKKKTDQPKLTSKAAKSAEDDPPTQVKHKYKSKKQLAQEQEERHHLKKGKYIKPKPEPYPDPDDPTKMKIDKVGRDFYVKWLHELFDLYFPDVDGDPIIQIGTTFKRYGEKELFLKHIITLKGCSKFTNAQMVDDENRDIFITKPKDAIAEAKKLKLDTPLIKAIQDRLAKAAEDGEKKPDIPELNELNGLLYIARRDKQLKNDNSVLRVECYDTEAEVILAWKKLIKELDPDIITGYNIFGFDFKYMWDRAEVLNVVDEFKDIGRISHKPEKLIEKKLVSSGLGDNLLYYISMTGRVVVDLLKVVQSGGYRLPIFKLDFVCNHFLYKRKNDLPPQQIFILQKGNDDDRAKIARYCLVDCILCNRLIDKLEIITNNIGMSKVCKVPLTYLFLRGQGIKILSLVSDITRKEGYLIKAKERIDKKSDEWYEGAIVLDPAKGIYFEPCVVADFNSLYPSCMIAWNLSHDSYIELGSKYDNLPKDEYYDVEYDLYKVEKIPGKKSTHRVKYGTKVCRYYQPKDGSKSMLPRILQKLLKARKDTRKEQKNFKKGTFEWNVKEGLQLAYKVTANSLYGQVGAKTSAVNFKDIAACTTACGRGLIQTSKTFCEDNYDGCTTVYGDSVTGDTPVIIRDPKTGKIYIKEIQELMDKDGNQDWKQYEAFKSHEPVGNRIQKQQLSSNCEVWSDKGWTKINKVIRHKCNKKIYRVSSEWGQIDVTEDHSLLTQKLDPIKPGQLKHDTQLLHCDNLPQDCEWIDKEANMNFHIDYDLSCGTYVPNNRSKKKLQETYIMFKEWEEPFFFDFQNGLIYYDHKLKDHKGVEELFKKSKIIIEDLGKLSKDEFVYDLDTQLGRFHAGIGELVAMNTDSIFVKFVPKNSRGEELYGLDAIYKNIELCTEASLGISRTLPKPHNLEFEKAIWPFMLVSKKRYHGHYYTVWGKSSFYPNSMGIVLKRRDNAKIVKHIFGGVLDIIMEEHDIQKSIRFCKEETKKLLEGKFPLDMFTITKTLKSYYKNPDQIAHNVLAQRIAERDPGNKPQSNDRMQFAYIKPPPVAKGDRVLQGNRIETPEFIKENNLELDYRFYLTNQVMKPVMQIFELVLDEKELIGIFGEQLMEYDRRQSGIQRITKWVSRKKSDDDPDEDDLGDVPAYGIIQKLLKEIDQERKKENLEDGDFNAKDGDEVLTFN